MRMLLIKRWVFYGLLVGLLGWPAPAVRAQAANANWQFGFRAGLAFGLAGGPVAAPNASEFV